MAEAPFYLTEKVINEYYQFKLDSGVSPVAVGKYKNAIDNLTNWLGDDRGLTALRLQEWRRYIENRDFSKHTIQTYVAVVNTMLRALGHAELCIPKPLRNDLRNQPFGYLTAIEPTDKRYRTDIIWKCRCRCGKEIEVPSASLIRMNTTSCGCLNMEILQHRNRYEEGTELRQSLEEKVRNPNSASGYVGVQPKRDKWVALIQYKKKVYRLGTFSNIEDAVKARAVAKEAVMEDAARIYEETDHLYGDSPHRPKRPVKEATVVYEPVIIPAKRSNNTSGCPGVTRSKGKWAANITVNKFRYRLGAYDELKDAVAARKNAEELVRAGDLEALKAISTNWNK